MQILEKAMTKKPLVPPNLPKKTHAEKDALILSLLERVSALEKDAEIAVQKTTFQRNLLRTLAEIFPHRIYAKDIETRFIFGNMAVAQGMGVLHPDDLLGKTDFSFYPETDAAQYLLDEQAIMRSGQPMMHHEEKAEYLLSKKVAWMLTTKVPLRDDDGDVIGIVGINYNITERKEMELELLARNAELVELNLTLSQTKAQLIHSEKMASIGVLAAGIAHEINNPVGFVKSNMGALRNYVDVLCQVLDGDEKVLAALPQNEMTASLTQLRKNSDLEFLKKDLADLLRESMDGLTRVKDIVQSLKDFAHVGEADWQFADLHQCIDSTLVIANNEIKYKAKVVRDFGVLPPVKCLASQLNQVFMNLIVNAAQAIKESGSITIRTGCQNDWVWVDIADDGVGIPAVNLSRIFDPFFTTKPVGQGTGLGLSLSYNIIVKHGGRIEVKSEIGKGTCFTIHLPVNTSDAAV